MGTENTQRAAIRFECKIPIAFTFSHGHHRTLGSPMLIQNLRYRKKEQSMLELMGQGWGCSSMAEHLTGFTGALEK